MTTAALELKDVTKTFDGFHALDRASFTAHAGQIHALLGENGAGKSTLMNVCCGLYMPDSGHLMLSGQEIHLSGPREAAARGIGMVHQHFKLVRPFTILENLLLAGIGPAAPGRSAAEQRKATRDCFLEQAQILGATIDPERRIDSLSIAEQQRVEVIKALVGGARILILDEPTAVLTDQEAEKLLLTLRRLAEQGTTIILVTHKLHDVKRFADHVSIMRAGRIVASLEPATASVKELTRLTVGDAVPPVPATDRSLGRRRLEFLDISAHRADGTLAVKDVSFHVRAGEIYGLAGVSGNGQSELSDMLMGLLQPDAGSIQFEDAGENLIKVDPSSLRALGAAFIPADRYRNALASGLSIIDNFCIGNVMRGAYGSLFWTQRKRMQADTQKALTEFDVQGVRTLSQKAALLSGGNAQKLVIAREFSNPPTIILAQSPSRGLDARATAAVHTRLKNAAETGAAILLVSEDLDEVMQLSNRIGVMAAGRLVDEFTPPFQRQMIGHAMVSHD